MTNTLDCDTYTCPQYDGKHGCKVKTVQLRNGVCLTYLSEMRYKKIGEFLEGIDKLVKSLPPAPESDKPSALEKAAV